METKLNKTHFLSREKDIWVNKTKWNCVLPVEWKYDSAHDLTSLRESQSKAMEVGEDAEWTPEVPSTKLWTLQLSPAPDMSSPYL